MDDIDLSLDFGDFSLDEQPEPRFLDVHSIVMAGERPSRTSFCLARERQQAEAALPVIAGRKENPHRSGGFPFFTLEISRKSRLLHRCSIL